MQDFQLSVIVPVFNAGRFVSKAVSSALIQEEVSEVVVIDDGSDDDSLAICLEIKENDCRVNVYQHPDGKNHGAGSSRNLGIEKARGEFIAFLDADDFYLPGRFKRDQKIFQAISWVDGVYNALGVYVYDEEERDRFHFNLTTVKYPILPEHLFEEMSPIGSAGYFSCDTLTVRRELFGKVGLFDSTLEIGEDTHMWVKMAAKASLVAGVIDRPVAMRGVHTENRVKDKSKFDYYRPLLFASLLKWANKNGVSVRRKRLLWNSLYRVHGKSVSNRKSSTLVKEWSMFFFLVRCGITNPYLFMHREYLSSFTKFFNY